MKAFQIISDDQGEKCACEVLTEPCARCAKAYAERLHKFEQAIWAASPGDLLSLCDRCAREYIDERPDSKLRMLAGWAARALTLVTLFVLGGVFGFLGVEHFLR